MKQKISQPKETLRQVKHLMTFGDSDTSVFCAKFDANDKYLAAGYGDGITRIYNVDTQKLAFTLYGMGGNEEMPVADLAWRPMTASMKTANVLVTAQADGTLKHWHATSGKCLHQTQEDEENHLYTLDFKPDGTLLAVAGRDKYIRVYDETTKTLAFAMKEKLDLPGHSNRIFCVKWNHIDQNQVVSGGWDQTIQIYDVRVRGPVAYIYGPNICGDSIAFRNDGITMVTGSYRWKDVIEVWDLRKMARTRVIDWDGTGDQILFPNESDAEITMPEDTSAQEEETKSLSNMQSTHQSYTTSQLAWTETAATRRKLKEPTVAPYLYTTKFNTQQDLLFCGGAGKNEMRVYDWASGSIVANISNLPKPIICGAQANNSSMFCFGAVDSRIRIFNIVNQTTSSARDSQSEMSSVFSRKR